MRVLHVVKTVNGAWWAARQAEVLARLGIDIHVAVPPGDGETLPFWRKFASTIHTVDLNLPLKRPWAVPAKCAAARRLVDDVQPDIIHSHFVGTTILLRSALGPNHPIPRVFQVPGPLHLEHAGSRFVEIRTAGPADYWIASSRAIVARYLAAGVASARLSLSYYGVPALAQAPAGYLRQRLGIRPDQKIIGNCNLIYPPKRYLGQFVGLKCHEDVIDALGLVLKARDDVIGVLIGATFGTSNKNYENSLRRRAEAAGRGRILMPGYFTPEEVHRSWPDFDCAVHVPLSENCGGVVDPVAAGIPTIASRVGGLPEVITDGVTGATVAVHDVLGLARTVIDVLDRPTDYRRMAEAGRRLVRSTFDLEKTAAEVVRIYQRILVSSGRTANQDPSLAVH
jgi:glycosyltransferase involved in cell wall biosynthesis